MEAKLLSIQDFYEVAAKMADCKSAKVAKKWWLAFVEVIVSEMYAKGSCRLPYIGIFNSYLIEESKSIQYGKDGNRHEYLVPERILPTFRPVDNFINDINGTGVTKEYRKRLRKGALVQRDYLRILRQEKLGIKDGEKVPYKTTE